MSASILPFPPFTRLILSLAATALLAACATEPMGSPPVSHVDGGTRMPVAGRNGWQFDRVLRFGDYSTSPVGLLVSRAAPGSANCSGGCNLSNKFEVGGVFREEFERRYTSATLKFAFTQVGPGAPQATVRAIHQFDRNSKQAVTTWFGIPTSVSLQDDVTSSLMGTIESLDEGHADWRFMLLSNVAQHDIARPTGWIVDDAGHQILLKHLPPPAGTPDFVQRMMRGVGGGFQFEQAGRVIGSVTLLPPATVWMGDDVAPDLRLAMAGFSSALLLIPVDH